MRSLLCALALAFTLVACDAAGPSVADVATANAGGGSSQSVSGPILVRPGATCTYFYSSPTPANGWGSFPGMSLNSSGSYAATFTVTGAHDTYSRIWAYNQETHTPIKLTVEIKNDAPPCEW